MFSLYLTAAYRTSILKLEMETRQPIFNEQELYGLLQQVNPWWRTGQVSGKLPALRRRAFGDVLQTLTHPQLRRFAVLSGARRVGKTTVMRQLISHLLAEGVPAANILYISFDNPVFKLSGLHAVLETYRQRNYRGGTCYYFLDEIQYAEDWSLWVKTLYDHYPDLQLVATGSASPALERGAADSGVGRWRVFRMPTMLFSEYCELQGIHPLQGPPPGPEALPAMSASELSLLMTTLGELTPHWYRYLEQGGFPELLATDDRETVLNILQEDVVDKVLKRDVPALFDVRNPVQLEKIFLYLCLHSGSVFNLDTMSSALGVSKPTLSRYISYLCDANLIYLSRNLCATGKKGLSAQPKIYVADAALRNAALMRYAPINTETEMGIVAEGAVYKHFLEHYGRSGEVGFMRGNARGKNEIDVAVMLRNGSKILCEVKYRNSSELSAKDALIAHCHGEEPALHLLATKSPYDFGRIEAPGAAPLFRIPATALCYLLT